MHLSALIIQVAALRIHLTALRIQVAVIIMHLTAPIIPLTGLRIHLTAPRIQLTIIIFNKFCQKYNPPNSNLKSFSSASCLIHIIKLQIHIFNRMPIYADILKMKSLPIHHREAFLLIRSEKRDSNPRLSAWEADTLPTELFSLINRANVVNLFHGGKDNLFEF